MISPLLALCASSAPFLATAPFSNGAGPAPDPESAAKAENLSPPGMVFIEGGRTEIGTDFDDLTDLLKENTQLLKNAGAFLAEHPDHTVDVDDFFLMVTEVTNEQFREYVLAAEARPPQTWGREAIDEGRVAFLEAEGKRIQEAKEEGRDPGKRRAFVESEWWRENWKEARWEMPPELAHKPVVYIDYQDARGYAEWAGLRLMTEEEYERAVRGDGDRPFPWGDDFQPGKHAATQGIPGASDIFDVGSFPSGATEQGVMDLAGNAWEWTRSKYVAYPGWEHETFTVGKGRNRKKIDAIPNFSPDRRVVRGGSIQNTIYVARCTTRGGYDRYQATSALSFRCAASIEPGYDFAVAREDDIPNQIRPQTEDGPVIYDPNQVVAIDRWITAKTTGGMARRIIAFATAWRIDHWGTAKTTCEMARRIIDSATALWIDRLVTAETTCQVPGYAVIKNYDYILFTPAESIFTTGVSEISKGARDDQVFHLGFLSTTREMVEPALPAGTYLVALRGEGEADEIEPETDDEGVELPTPPTLSDLVEFDPTVENFIFYDMQGAPVVAVPVAELEYANPTSSELEVVERTILVPVGEDEEIEVVQQWLDLKLFVKGKSRKGVRTTLSLRFEDGVLEGDWR